MLAGVVLLSFAIPSVSLAQQTDTVRRATVQPTPVQSSTVTGAPARNTYEPRENIYRLGRGVYTDTLNRNDFKVRASDVAEIDDCDTTLQTFVLVRRDSPWRVGLFAGPNFAYCGTWENTFGPNKRDQTLYNGVGFNITANIDYYFSRPTRRLRFGVGTAFGYQNYVTRNIYRDYLYGLAAARGFTRDQVTIRQRASEDMFITVGPVVQFTIARSRRRPGANTFLELGARGGLFRTEAATIAAYVPSAGNIIQSGPLVGGGALIRTVNPSPSLYHLGGLLSLGVFFPLRNYWHLGVQAQGFYTRLNYLIVNGDQNPSLLYEFRRKHGGFSGGLALRKDFVQKRLIPKAPIVCPTCDSIPQLNVTMNGTSLKGVTMMETDSAATSQMGSASAVSSGATGTTSTTATGPVISWRSTTPAAARSRFNETFTARLYYRPDSVSAGGTEQVIAEVVDSKDTTLAFPAAYMGTGRPRHGFYYVTVHNNQRSKCGTCMSDVATTSFAVIRPTGGDTCRYRHRLERLEVFYRTPSSREVTSVCYCQGSIVPGSERKVNRLFFRGLNRRLATGEVEFDTTALILNLRDLPGNLAQQLQAEKSKIESSNAIRHKGRRVRPQVQYFRTIFTVTKLPCNGQPEQTLGSFNATISDNSYSITDLKPITQEQRTKLLAPPAPKKAKRRAGNSGRREDVMFGVEN